MTLRDVFEQSLEVKLIDLQVLIMFLVMEKKVHTWDDDVSVLDLYFLPKHQERMSKELLNYKEKIGGMKYPPSHFEVKTSNQTYYILANDEQQAKAFMYANGIRAEEINYVADDDLFYRKGRFFKIKELTKNTKAPYLIGGY